MARVSYSTVQSQKAVSAYFPSKQIADTSAWFWTYKLCAKQDSLTLFRFTLCAPITTILAFYSFLFHQHIIITVFCQQNVYIISNNNCKKMCFNINKYKYFCTSGIVTKLRRGGGGKLHQLTLKVLIYLWLPSKHEKLTQFWVYVGPSSKTVAQH